MKILFVERDENFVPVKYPRNTKEEKLIFKEIYLEAEYKWYLSRYVGEWDLDFNFSHAASLEKVKDLSVEYLLDILNNDYCFDFDYEPEEGDILDIQYDYKYPDLRHIPNRYFIRCSTCVMFRDGKWIFDRYYDVKLKRITQGFIKIVS